MINTSSEYRKTDTNLFYAKVNITLLDGTELDVDLDDIMQGGLTITDGVSPEGEFVVGSAIINKATVILRNSENQFSRYDFRGAQIKIKVGKQLENHIEWLPKGVFYTDSAMTAGETIIIEALDRMANFDQVYDTGLSYPSTLGQIVQDACYRCNVPLRSASFFNSHYMVDNRPTGEMTYREIIAYAAQLSGSFARVDNTGYLEIKWFDTAALKSGLDGGNFIDYESGDRADGGDFKDYGSGHNYDAGGFDELRTYHHLYKLSELNVSTDDIAITGIKLTKTVTGGEGQEETTNSYFYGQEGYVLVLEENPLAQDRTQELVNSIGSKVVGMVFRPLTCQALGEPAIEAGDVAIVSDRKGNSYPCVITNINYTLGSYASFTCDAKTDSEQNSLRFNPYTKLEHKIATEVGGKLNDMDQQFSQFNDLMSNAMGFYETVEQAEDGSRINYLHDKPDLKDSVKIWKISVDGYGVSLDGGKTWTSGMSADGNIIGNILSVIGINAEWITAGIIRAIHLEGCNIRGGVIESKDSEINPTKKTMIIGGQLMTNNIFLTDIDNEGQVNSAIMPSLFTLWNKEQTKKFIVDLSDNVIQSTATLSIDGNIYAFNGDLQIKTINGQNVVTPYTLRDYVGYSDYSNNINSIWQNIGQLWQAIANK